MGRRRNNKGKLVWILLLLVVLPSVLIPSILYLRGRNKRQLTEGTGLLSTQPAGSDCTKDSQCKSGICEKIGTETERVCFGGGVKYMCPYYANYCKVTPIHGETEIWDPGHEEYVSSMSGQNSYSLGCSNDPGQYTHVYVDIIYDEKECTLGYCGDGVVQDTLDEECDYKSESSKYQYDTCPENERRECLNNCFYSECECYGNKKRCSDRQPQICQNGDWVNNGDVCKYGCYGEGECNECEPNTVFCEGDYVISCDGDDESGWFKSSSYCTYGCNGGECNPAPECPESCPDDGNPCTREFCNRDTYECDKENLDGPQEGWSGYAGSCKLKTCNNGIRDYEEVKLGQYSDCGQNNPNEGCVNGVCKSCDCDETIQWERCDIETHKHWGLKQECDKTTFDCVTRNITETCHCNPGDYRCSPFNDRLIQVCEDYNWVQYNLCEANKICQELI